MLSSSRHIHACPNLFYFAHKESLVGGKYVEDYILILQMISKCQSTIRTNRLSNSLLTRTIAFHPDTRGIVG